MGQEFEELDIVLGGKQCDLPVRRPDSIISTYREENGQLYSTVVVCSIDEHSHISNYLPECESARMWDISESVRNLLGKHTTVWFVRFNPHIYQTVTTPLEERIQKVGDCILDILDQSSNGQYGNPVAPNAIYAYYHTGGQKHIHYSESSNGINVVDFN
jgi:hypothetical protein